MQTNTLAVTVLPAGKGNLTVNIGKRTIPFPFRSFPANRTVKDNAAVEGVETSVLKFPYPKNQGGGWQLNITVGTTLHEFWVNDDASKVEPEKAHRQSLVQAWAESKPDGLLAELEKGGVYSQRQHHRHDNRGQDRQGNRPPQPQHRKPNPPRQPQHPPKPPQAVSGSPAPAAKATPPPRPSVRPEAVAAPTPASHKPAPPERLKTAAEPQPPVKPADQGTAAVIETPAPAGGRFEMQFPNNCTAVIRVTVTENLRPDGSPTGESRTEAQAIVRETQPANAVVTEARPVESAGESRLVMEEAPAATSAPASEAPALNPRVARFLRQAAQTSALKAAAAAKAPNPAEVPNPDSSLKGGDRQTLVITDLKALSRSDLNPGT